MAILCALLDLLVSILVTTITVGDSGVGQRQLNGIASKNTLQLSDFNKNQCITSL